MNYVKPFQEFDSVNEGVFVYPPGNPYEKERTIQWPGLVDWINKWQGQGQHFSLVCDVDYDKHTADPKYRSVPLGTWGDKSLPLFTEENPRYDEVDFDLVEIVDNPEKPREPYLKIVDKNGIEFMIPPFKVMEVQRGDSVVDNIRSGSKYLIDKMRATIVNYKNGKILVRLQDGSVREYDPQQWKSKNFTEIDEKRNNGMLKTFESFSNESTDPQIHAHNLEKHCKEVIKALEELDDLRNDIEGALDSEPSVYWGGLSRGIFLGTGDDSEFADPMYSSWSTLDDEREYELEDQAEVIADAFSPIKEVFQAWFAKEKNPNNLPYQDLIEECDWDEDNIPLIIEEFLKYMSAHPGFPGAVKSGLI